MAKNIVFRDNDTALEVSQSGKSVPIMCESRDPEEMMLQRTIYFDKTDVGELIETLNELNQKME